MHIRILILQVHKNKSNDKMNKEQTIKGKEQNKIKSNFRVDYIFFVLFLFLININLTVLMFSVWFVFLFFIK